MRILFVAHERMIGGASKALLEILEELKDNKDVTACVLCPGKKKKNNPFLRELKKLGVETIGYKYYSTLINQNAKVFSVHYLLRLAALFIDVFTSLRLYFVLKKHHFDIIHSNTSVLIMGVLLSKLLGIPHIQHVRECIEDAFGKKLCLSAVFNGFIYRKSAAVIFSSASLKKRKTEICEVKNAIVHKDSIGPNYRNKREIVRKEKTNILLAGFIRENKGQLEAVLAVHSLIKKGYDVRLFLAGGSGERLNEYFYTVENYIAQNCLEDKVIITGYIDDLKRFREEKEIDIELSCSKHEGFGRTIVEAMLGKSAVICSDVPALNESIIDGFNGLLYKRGDYHALAQKIGLLISDFEFREKMVKNAFDYAEKNYSNKDYVYGLVEIYLSSTGLSRQSKPVIIA